MCRQSDKKSFVQWNKIIQLFYILQVHAAKDAPFVWFTTASCLMTLGAVILLTLTESTTTCYTHHMRTKTDRGMQMSE